MRVAVLAALAVIVAACGSSTADGPDIPVQDADLVAAGEVVYQANCASCHGSDLRGTDLGPSHLSVVYEPGHHGDGAIELAIRIGSRQHHWPFGDMAPVEGLSEEDIESVTAYIREQQRINGFEPYPP